MDCDIGSTSPIPSKAKTATPKNCAYDGQYQLTVPGPAPFAMDAPYLIHPQQSGVWVGACPMPGGPPRWRRRAVPPASVRCEATPPWWRRHDPRPTAHGT